MGTNTIKNLFEQGKYKAVLDHLENLDGEDKLEGEVFKITILLYNGQQEDALKLADRIINQALEKDLKIVEVKAVLAKCEVLRTKYNYLLSSSDQKPTSLLEVWLQTINQAEILLQTIKHASLGFKDELKAELLQHQGLYYRTLKKYDEALSKLEKSKEMCEKLQYQYLLATVSQHIGWIMRDLNDRESELKYFQDALLILQQLGNNLEIVHMCNDLGWTCLYLNENVLASNYFQQGLDIATNIEYKLYKSIFHIDFGWVYRNTEKFDLALEEFQKGKNIAEEINSKNYVAWSLWGIGAAYIGKGQLDLALEVLMTAWKFNWHRWGIEALIGEVYWGQNLLEKAIEYLESSLTGVLQLFSLGEQTCWIFFNLVVVNLELKQNEKAEEYFKSFQKYIKESQPSKSMNNVFRLAEARLLKESSRMANKIEAMKIFEQIVKENKIQIRHRTYALLNLCDLLFLEFKSLGEEEILIEIQNKINYIIEIANNSQSHITMVELLLVKSKLALIRGNLTESQQLLEESKFSAEKYQLEHLISKIEQEEIEFNKEFQKWSDLVNKNTPIAEMMEKTRIQNYINEALSTKEKTLRKITNF